MPAAYRWRELATFVLSRDVETYLLGIDRGSRHVRNRGVAASPWVLGVPEWVILGRRLGEPDIAAVSTEVARLERLGDVLLHNDGTTGSVNQP